LYASKLPLKKKRKSMAAFSLEASATRILKEHCSIYTTDVPPGVV
jgi:hypothetical protein